MEFLNHSCKFLSNTFSACLIRRNGRRGWGNKGKGWLISIHLVWYGIISLFYFSSPFLLSFHQTKHVIMVELNYTNILRGLGYLVELDIIRISACQKTWKDCKRWRFEGSHVGLFYVCSKCYCIWTNLNQCWVVVSCS